MFICLVDLRVWPGLVKIFFCKFRTVGRVENFMKFIFCLFFSNFLFCFSLFILLVHPRLPEFTYLDINCVIIRWTGRARQGLCSFPMFTNYVYVYT